MEKALVLLSANDRKVTMTTPKETTFTISEVDWNSEKTEYTIKEIMWDLQAQVLHLKALHLALLQVLLALLKSKKKNNNILI